MGCGKEINVPVFCSQVCKRRTYRGTKISKNVPDKVHNVPQKVQRSPFIVAEEALKYEL